MKLKLYGVKNYEVLKKFPQFELDTKRYPELQLEIEAVADAYRRDDSKYGDVAAPLETLIEKMWDTEVDISNGSFDSETQSIMDCIDPFDDFENASDEQKIKHEQTFFEIASVVDDDEDSGSQSLFFLCSDLPEQGDAYRAMVPKQGHLDALESEA